MLKVTVRRAGTGVATASSLLLATGSGTLGCAADMDDPSGEPTAEAEDALTPGTGTLALDGFPGGTYIRLGVSSTDEFLRAGEVLNLELPAWLLWDTLYPGMGLPDTTRLSQLAATVNVIVIDKATTIATLKVPTASFKNPGDPYGYTAVTKSFTVPTKADWLKFEIVVTDALAPGQSATLGQNQLSTLAVFGGELPQKSLFFDTVQSTKRQRVIEGDDPIAGTKLNFAYTDWRADVIVDKTSIDLQIGKAQSASRFGWVTVPIYGKLVHEVAYGVFFDDGLGWRPEAPLTANATSRYVGAGRTSFEVTLDMPAKARRMAMYVHVKSYVIADYSGVQNITEKWYMDGEKVLKADKYDNPNGPFTNYTFSITNL
jgi:hypothetical protein